MLLTLMELGWGLCAHSIKPLLHEGLVHRKFFIMKKKQKQKCLAKQFTHQINSEKLAQNHTCSS